MRELKLEWLDISKFPDNLVKFKVSRVLNARAFWIDEATSKEGVCSSGDEEAFLGRYAYIIKDNELNDGIIFSESDDKNLLAERYGGLGVGTNGGGVRCGNDGNIQIKGIGRNPLGINTVDQWHSYGGLNLVDAIYETIYSVLLNKIMPLGVSRVYGLIIVGDNSGLLPGIANLSDKRSYGALLVRESCIRPAHFLPCPDFSIKAVKHLKVSSDYSRVRNTNRMLSDYLKTKENFISYIGQCVANHANQFAFARVARIRHGSISASNSCLDGRWLDLTNASFIDGQGDYCTGRSFLEEANHLVTIFDEFLHNFSKYNKIKLNFSFLKKYYFNQFNAYLIKHSAYLLGIPFSRVPEQERNRALIQISKHLLSLISANKKLIFDRPSIYMENDPIIESVTSLYCSISAESSKVSENDSLSSITHLFISLIKEIYGGSSYTHTKALVTASSIISLRRLYAAEYFFMGRLEGCIYTSVRERNENMCSEILKESISVIDWAFDREENLIDNNTLSHVTIFKSFNTHIYYNIHRSTFTMRNEGLITHYEDFNNILEICKENENLITIFSHSFLKYLQKIGFVNSAICKGF
jgi:hypothetical protein